MLSTSRALAIWIVIVAALALIVLVRHSHGSGSAPRVRRFEAALRRRPETVSQPVELLRMERELEEMEAAPVDARERVAS